MIKKGQKFKYLKNEKSFQHEIKSIFHHFKGLSSKQIKTTFSEGEGPTLLKGVYLVSHFKRGNFEQLSVIRIFKNFIK